MPSQSACWRQSFLPAQRRLSRRSFHRGAREVDEVDLSDHLTLRTAITDDVREAMILLSKKRKSKTRAGLTVLCRALYRALHPLMVSVPTESLARIEEEVEEEIALSWPRPWSIPRPDGTGIRLYGWPCGVPISVCWRCCCTRGRTCRRYELARLYEEEEIQAAFLNFGS